MSIQNLSKQAGVQNLWPFFQHLMLLSVWKRIHCHSRVLQTKQDKEVHEAGVLCRVQPSACLATVDWAHFGLSWDEDEAVVGAVLSSRILSSEMLWATFCSLRLRRFFSAIKGQSWLLELIAEMQSRRQADHKNLIVACNLGPLFVHRLPSWGDLKGRSLNCLVCSLS